MRTSYTCPRCGRWHLSGGRCDKPADLIAFGPHLSQIQEAADAAETKALARYPLARSR